MQSAPVSPPPMTMTFLSAAEVYVLSSSFESNKLLVLRVRKSIANWTPANSRPGHCAVGSNGLVAPVAISSASFSFNKSLGSMNRISQPRSSMIWVMWPEAKSSFLPTCAQVTNCTPSSRNKFTRRSTTSLSSFMFGMPYISNPPMRSARS